MSYDKVKQALTSTPVRLGATAAVLTLASVYVAEGTACAVGAIRHDDTCNTLPNFVSNYMLSVMKTAYDQLNFAKMAVTTSVMHGVFAGGYKAIKDRFCKKENAQSPLDANLFEGVHDEAAVNVSINP